MRGRLALLASAALLAACGQQPTAPVDEPVGPDGDIAEGVAWEQLDQVEDALPDRAAAAVLTDADALTDAWDEHGFASEASEVNFDDYVVVLLAQADDACPDELSRLEVVDGQLEVEWVPPPGACAAPLVHRVHAIRVHRAVLGDGFSYGPDAPYEDEFASVTIDLPGYDAEAPPPPEVTQQMSDAELDAVFADHPVARCGPDHEPLDRDAPAPAGDPAPVAPVDDTNDALADAGIEVGREVVPFVDSSSDGRLAYFVGEDHADLVEKTLTDRFGKEAPGIRIAKWAPTDVLAAQGALTALMSGDREPGTIVGMSGPPGPVHIDMVDPTREALDAVVDLVDPNLVCVTSQLSGVATQSGAAEPEPAPADQPDAATPADESADARELGLDGQLDCTGRERWESISDLAEDAKGADAPEAAVRDALTGPAGERDIVMVGARTGSVLQDGREVVTATANERHTGWFVTTVTGCSE